MKKMYLDDEERDLVESIERGEWKSVRNLKAEIKKHQEYARNTLKAASTESGRCTAGLDHLSVSSHQVLGG